MIETVKISELSELASQLQVSDYIPIVRGGVTYKYAPYGYVVKNSGNETIAGVKTFSSSPIVPAGDSTGEAVNFDQLSIVEDKATPLSDLSRVCQINGDGVPMFPDNVAGRTYWQDEWATTDGWTASASNATLSVSNGNLVITGNGSASYVEIEKPGNALNKIHIVRCKNNPDVTQIGYYNGTDLSYQTPVRQGSIMWAMFYTSGSWTEKLNVFFDFGRTTTASDIVYLDTIYIGSGLYDTPVYDKAGCNRATNYGVLPVKGTRGQALSFNGGQYLQFDNPVIGTTGTIAGRFSRVHTGNTEMFFGNYASGIYDGLQVIFEPDGDFVFNVLQDNSTSNALTVKTNVVDALTHTWCVISSGSTLTPVFDGVFGTPIPGAFVIGAGPLHIGRNPDSATLYFNGTVYDFRYDSSIWTQADVTRYHNGDDAVDSQQKAINNVPHAIKICDSKGHIRQPGLPVYADNTAALAGGLVAGEPYRTSTGVMMITY